MRKVWRGSIPAATYAYTSLSLLPKPAYSPPVPRPPPPPKHAAIAAGAPLLEEARRAAEPSRSADSVDVCVVVKTGPSAACTPTRGRLRDAAARAVGRRRVWAWRRGRRGRRRGAPAISNKKRRVRAMPVGPRAGRAVEEEDGVAARRERARKLADARVHPRLVGEAAQVADDVVHRHRAVDVEDDGRRVRVPQVDERLRRDALAQVVHHLVPPGDERAGRDERRELEARRRGEFLRSPVFRKLPPASTSGVPARSCACRRGVNTARVNTAGCSTSRTTMLTPPKSTATPFRRTVTTLLPLRGSRSNSISPVGARTEASSCRTHSTSSASPYAYGARQHSPSIALLDA